MANKPAAIAIQTFKVSPQRVYDAILAPDMVVQWMFGPLLREEIILHIHSDLRVGGEFSYKVRRGDAEIDHVGKFLELDPPRRIVFTWGVVGESADDPSHVIIDITPTAEGCSVRLMHEMDEQWAAYLDRARASWEKMLGVLASLA